MVRFVSLLFIVPLASISNALDPGSVPTVPQSLPGVKMATAPKIDGKFDPGEWPSEAHGEGFFDKDTGLASDEKGEFWIGYDDHHVYFAARAVTDPHKLVDEEYRTNVNLAGNDAFILGLDATANGQDFDLFWINPQGATQLRLAGGRAAKTEWIGDFESAGLKTDQGWQLEAAVPWSLIRRPGAGKHDLVFNVLWFRSNKGNTYEWVYTKGDFKKFPILTGVDCPSVANGRSLKLLPYAYAGYDKDIKHIANAGLDMKTEISDNVTVVGTVNPDFRNVENAILSLDFSYFERLADESRPFFQEGSRYRNFGMFDRIFASQRAGEFDAGLNAYGAFGPTTFGFLATQDFGERSIASLSTATRIDANRSISFGYAGNFERGKRSTAGRAFYDHRLGDWNLYSGIDATSDQVGGSGHRATAGGFKSSDGTTVVLDYTEASPNYFPRIGFAPEVDYRAAYVEYEREMQPYGKTIRDYNYGVQANYADHYHGGEYRRSLTMSGGLTLTNRLSIRGRAQVERFEGSNDHFLSLRVGYPVDSPYRGVEATLASGRFSGSDYKSIGLNARYRPIRKFQLDLRSQWTEYQGGSRQTVLSANYDVGKYEAVGGRLVRLDDNWNWYVSYRLSGRRGNEFFLILGDPNAPEFRKSLILKAVMPITIRY